MQSRRYFLKTLGSGGISLAIQRHLAANGASAKKPNIIFFFTDDQGWQDMKNAGHPYLKTPNIDRLAKEGTRFDQFYSSSSVCSPSRAAFMTGHFPARHRIHQHLWKHGHNKHLGMPDFLDPNAETVTRILQKAGYRTGHYGKWHLGSTSNAPEPGAYGIDEYRTYMGNGPSWDKNGNRAEKDLARASYDTCTDKDRFWTHSTGLFVDEAIEFMQRNEGKPFYLNLWAILPHAPNRPTPEQLKVYKDLKPDPKDFDSWMRRYAESAKDFDAQMKTYCSVMTEIDTALGRLLDHLDKMKLTDNTLFFFTSDNGPEDYHIGNVRNSGMGATDVLRARKRSLYEGGIRVPCIARWPKTIPAGRVEKDSVLCAVDWLPTVCKLAGVPVPDIKPDGEDVSDILLGKSRPRTTSLFWEWQGGIAGNKAYRPPRLAIREENWKLFCDYEGKKQELYDIPKDPEERNNVAAKHINVVDKLLPKLLDWKKDLPK